MTNAFAINLTTTTLAALQIGLQHGQGALGAGGRPGQAMDTVAAPVLAPVIERASLLAALRGGRPWDVLVIGGGATGLGIAVDAAAACSSRPT